MYRLTGWWHRHVLCRLGKHRMKFGGCMYCGAGGKQQPRFYI
jgi:hypothetical protein